MALIPGWERMGATLPGGQRQRLAIARALYHYPEILILYEASSNLNSESEFYVKQTMQSLCNQGKTIILISHRLSSLSGTDRIIDLEKGEIRKQGTQEELYRKQKKSS